MSKEPTLKELRKGASARTYTCPNRACELTDFPDGAESLDESPDPTRRLLSRDKRARAAFFTASCVYATAKDHGPAISADVAAELYQTSALIHNGIPDAALVRRFQSPARAALTRLHLNGGWSNGRAHFGTSLATLLGDFPLSPSTEAFAGVYVQVDPRASRTALRAFIRTTTEVAFDQYLDIRAENAPSIADSVGVVLSVIACKSTRYSVVFPLRIGTLLTGASGGVLGLLERVGAPLGEAFQLRNDDLGVFEGEKVIGKPVCGDIAQGKRTVLLILIPEHLNGANHGRFIGFLGKRIEPDDARWVQEAGVASGARSAHEDMTRHRGTAVLTVLDTLRSSGLALANGLAMAESLIFELIGRVSQPV